MFKKKGKVSGKPGFGINVLGALKDNVAEGVGMVASAVGRTSTGLKKTVNKATARNLLPKQKMMPLKDLGSAFGRLSVEKTEKLEEEETFLRDALRDNFLFAGQDHTRIDGLIGAFEKFEVKKNDYVFREGDTGDFFYILYKGKLTFEKAGEKTGTSDDKTPYCCFGELALLQSIARPHSVLASTNCVLFRLDQVNFRLVVQHKGKTQDEKKVEFLAKVPALEEFDNYTLAKLASAMESFRFKKGDVLFKKGDIISSFLVVYSGKLLASNITSGGSKYEDVIIGPGEVQQSIGFNSLLKDEPIMGDVVAKTNVTVMVIDGASFKKQVGGYESLVARRQKIMQLQAMAIFKDSKLGSTEFAGLVDLMVSKEYRRRATIFNGGDKVDAAFYFVRTGKVEIENHEGDIKIIEEGGYFGQEQFLADQNKSATKRPFVPAEYHARALDGCVLDILSLEEARAVIDTRRIGLGKSVKISAIDDTIDINDITRHVMLGSGSFGQVWLASYGKTAKDKRVFALKVQSKHQLIESNQAEGVIGEVNIMASLKSPFIIRLYSTFQDKQRVYMLTSLLQGGELDDVIGDGLDEDSAKFYAAGVLEGLTYMHRRHIIHRDLKPENVMIDNLGYPVLIDLGFAKYVPDKTYTCCGTPMYMAPEVVNFSGHDKGADHWSWAAMVFEMVTGHYAFYNTGIDEVTMFKRICRGEFKVNGDMSYEFKLLLISMLIPDSSKRLGSRSDGWKDIFKSPWFKDIDLKKLRKRELTAPWVPKLKDPLDSSNFDDCEVSEDKMKVVDPEISAEQQKIFESFGPSTDSAEC